jgi:hypothetical protein
LQGQYTAALSRITGAPKSENQKRHTPICQRTQQPDEKQALREAANALSAIWKIGQSRVRPNQNFLGNKNEAQRVCASLIS